jgi:hypothetical protein
MNQGVVAGPQAGNPAKTLVYQLLLAYGTAIMGMCGLAGAGPLLRTFQVDSHGSPRGVSVGQPFVHAVRRPAQKLRIDETLQESPARRFLESPQALGLLAGQA